MDGLENILATCRLSIRSRLDQFFRTLGLPVIFPPSQLTEYAPQNIAAPAGFSSDHLDPPLLILGFSFTAMSMAMQRVQNMNKLPMTFHLVCLAMILSFAALCLSVYLSRKSEVQRQVLQHVGVFFGATAFFFAITICFPLWFKLIAWSIYAISLLWIFISYRA